VTEQRLETYRGVVDVLAAGNTMGVDATDANHAVSYVTDSYQAGTDELRAGVDAALDAVEGLSPGGRFADRGRDDRRRLLKAGSGNGSPDSPGRSNAFLVLDAVKLAIVPFVPADLRWNIGELAL
jgi:hypothetical protein